MAIIGAHSLVYSPEADAVRAVFSDVLGLEHVDAGEGWLIFRLPPGEVGVHPSEEGGAHHELSFMCDDIEATVAELSAKGIVFSGPPENRGYGIAADMQLPGGLVIQVYQPRHTTAI